MPIALLGPVGRERGWHSHWALNKALLQGDARISPCKGQGWCLNKEEPFATTTLMQQSGSTKAERELPATHKGKFTGRNIKELVWPQATD